VHQRQLAVRGSLRSEQLNLRQFMPQTIAQQTVLGHGKTMTFGERQYKLVGIKGAHKA
jgi:hypothetical protein